MSWPGNRRSKGGVVEDFSWTSLAIQVAMGFSLAAVTGFRAFLPLLAAGGAARLGLIPLGSAFTWLQSDEALLILAVATLLEFLGDKIPVVDHVLDTAGCWSSQPQGGWWPRRPCYSWTSSGRRCWP